MVFVYCQETVEEDYYVTATGDGCPPLTTYCHSLDYYANLTQWNTGNITLIFLPGEHNTNGSIIINTVHSVTLTGLSQHITTIKCTSIFIGNVASVSVSQLTFMYKAPLTLNDVTNILIEKVTAGSLKIQNCDSSLRILQSKFKFMGTPPAQETVKVQNIRHTAFIHETIIIAEANWGGLYMSTDSVCLHTIISNSIFVAHKSTTVVNIPIQYDDNLICPYANVTFTNVTISGSSFIYVRYNGNINFTDIKIANIERVSLESDGHQISLTRVSIANGGLFITNCEYATLTNVSVINSPVTGIKIQFCNTATLTNVFESNSTGGLVLRHIKGIVYFVNCTITNNSKSGLYASGNMLLSFINYPSFITNNISPDNGGGMWISESTTLIFSKPVFMINNTARGVGGAIFANVDESASLMPYCTIDNVIKLFFQDNVGQLGGNDVYGGFYWDCCIPTIIAADLACNQNVKSMSAELFAKQINCSDNPHFSNYFTESLQSHFTSNPIGVCMCVNNGDNIDCSIRNINREIYPGQSINLSLVTVGVCGELSPGQLVTSGNEIDVLLLRGTNQETSGKHCKNFSYKLQPTHNNMKGSFVLAHKALPGEKILTGSSFAINLTFLSCPLGLVLSSKMCQCNNAIGSINDTQCSIDWMPHPIRRSGNNWLSYNQQYNCTVAQKNCPFDYCNSSTVYLDLIHPDLQCTNGRSGILCGKCQPGLSLMLGSNKCAACEDTYLTLAVAFIFAGFTLVVILLVSNLTVSVGSINGLLFYVNVFKLNEAALFPNGISVPVLSQFIAWFNLDLGIQTCFFNGMDGYWKTWLQFVFPIYIWLLIGVIIIACYYFGKLSRLCGNNAVPVLATLILVSYNKLLRTITNALMFAMIQCEPNKKWNVWSVDGNINYLSGKHVPLFLAALLFLIIGLVYTGLVFSIQWLKRHSGKYCKVSRDPVIKLKPLLDAYTGPYKDKYRYWTGLLLIVRLLLTTVFSYTTGTIPQINNYITAFVAFIMLFLSRGVYRRKEINLLEYFHLINLGSLSLLNGLSDHVGFDDSITTTLTSVSVSLSLLVFIGTVLAHFFKKAYCCSCRKKIKKTENRQSQEINSKTNDEEYMYSPANFIISDREPLIFDL